MFKYVVKGYGCNGAGESEEWTEYNGTNRLEALNGYKRALAWMGCATVDITVLGREWQKDARRKEDEYEQWLIDREFEDYEDEEDEPRPVSNCANDDVEEPDWDLDEDFYQHEYAEEYFI